MKTKKPEQKTLNRRQIIKATGVLAGMAAIGVSSAKGNTDMFDPAEWVRKADIPNLDALCQCMKNARKHLHEFVEAEDELNAAIRNLHGHTDELRVPAERLRNARAKIHDYIADGAFVTGGIQRMIEELS